MIVAITDPRYSLERILEVIERARAVLPDLVVQHRDKRSSPEDRARAAKAIVATGVRTIINGSPEDALRFGAHGVHLPGADPDVSAARAVLGPAAWISIAAHEDAAVERAATAGATAAFVSPIFETEGKGPARGIEALTRARAIASGRTRIIALGGVDSRRAASCFAAGADGIAAIRAIFDASDPASTVLGLLPQARPLRP